MQSVASEIYKLNSMKFVWDCEFRLHFGNILFVCVDGLRRETGLSPPVKYFTDSSKAVLLLWIFYVFSVLCLLCNCASVYMCLVVTCWEMADLLALVCGVQL